MDGNGKTPGEVSAKTHKFSPRLLDTELPFPSVSDRDSRVPSDTQIQYITGDATAPIGKGNKIIAHVCNDVGAWGAGFVLAISKRWPQPRAEYMKDKTAQSLKLGTVSLVRVERTVWVANMVAQRDIRWRDGVPPIRYDALLECLKQLGFHAHQLNATIHMPRIGCGLAGGKWERVEPLLRETIPGTQIFVYDLPR
jgi:O-acetyl-ADP-ribose deacetylase (regulator of RNase III)